MDPDAAYSLATDDTADRDERADAAAGLAQWIRRGGFLPSAPWSTAPDTFRRDAILAECDRIERNHSDHDAVTS